MAVDRKVNLGQKVKDVLGHLHFPSLKRGSAQETVTEKAKRAGKDIGFDYLPIVTEEDLAKLDVDVANYNLRKVQEVTNISPLDLSNPHFSADGPIRTKGK